MELKEFISSTLAQIAEGVKEAQTAYETLGGAVNPSKFQKITGGIATARISSYQGTTHILCNVHFDVVLTEESGTSGKTGIGVALGAVSLGGGKTSSSGSTSVTGISFDIPVELPSQ